MLFLQACPAWVFSKSVKQECPTKLSWRVFQRYSNRVSSQRVKQSVPIDSLGCVFYTSVPPECGARVSCTSVSEERPIKVSHNTAPQKYLETVCHKSVKQECPTRLPEKSVKQECSARVVFMRSSTSCLLFRVLQEPFLYVNFSKMHSGPCFLPCFFPILLLRNALDWNCATGSCSILRCGSNNDMGFVTQRGLGLTKRRVEKMPTKTCSCHMLRKRTNFPLNTVLSGVRFKFPICSEHWGINTRHRFEVSNNSIMITFWCGKCMNSIKHKNAYQQESNQKSNRVLCELLCLRLLDFMYTQRTPFLW